MPLRVSNSVERNIVPVPSAPIVVPDSQSTLVMPDVTKDYYEYSARYIQNVGANDLYYAFGADCSPANFNGILAKPGSVNANGDGSGQQLDVSNMPCKVTVYSIGGTKVSVTQMRRNDLVPQGNVM